MNMMKYARQSFGNPFYHSSIPAFIEDAMKQKETAVFIPAVNISEDEKNWHIDVSAPGFKKEDFSIKLENDNLIVSAARKTEEMEEKKNYSRQEFNYSSFSRSFRLPKGKANEEGINATYENGILILSIPKKEEVKKEALKEIKVS